MRKGIDISHWEPKIDWTKVVDAGYSFVFIKATDGLGIDPMFETHARNSFGALDRGIFHWYNPAYTPKNQAANFWDAYQFSSWQLPPVVDLEGYTTGQYHGSHYWYDFCANFYALSGFYPAIYTGYYYWLDQAVKNPVLDMDWFAEHCDLWIARYSVDYPFIPRPWTKWKWWQFSESGLVSGVTDGLGRPTECDEDLMNDGIPTTPPEETPMQITGTVKSTATPYLVLRVDHVPAADVVTRMYPNTRIEADAQFFDVTRTWLHITRVNGVDLIGWAAADYIDWQIVGAGDEIAGEASVSLTINGELYSWSDVITLRKG